MCLLINLIDEDDGSSLLAASQREIQNEDHPVSTSENLNAESGEAASSAEGDSEIDGSSSFKY